MDPNQLYVFVYLPKESALANGKTCSGGIAVPLTEALLEGLTQEERANLAFSCADAKYPVSNDARLTVSALTNEAITLAVRKRLEEARAEREVAAERQAKLEAAFVGPVEGRLSYDPTRDPGLQWSYRSEIASLTRYTGSDWDRLNAEQKALNEADRLREDARLSDLPVSGQVAQYIDPKYRGEWHSNAVDSRYTCAKARAMSEAIRLNALRAAAQLREFEAALRPTLTPEQWERYQAGVLPAEERDDALRNSLFVAELAEFEPTLPTEVPHLEDCQQEGDIRFVVKDYTDLTDLNLTADEFAAVRRVRSTFGEHPQLVSIVYRIHTGECRECEEECASIGARVTLNVSGHTYSREYKIT